MTLRARLLAEADLVGRDRWGGDFEKEYLDGLRSSDTWAEVNRRVGVSAILSAYMAHRLIRRFRALRRCLAGVAVIDANKGMLRMVMSAAQLESLRMWLSGEKQIDIGVSQGVSQASVSYRLREAYRALSNCSRRLEETKWLSPLILAVRVRRRTQNLTGFQSKPDKWHRKTGWGPWKPGSPNLDRRENE